MATFVLVHGAWHGGLVVVASVSGSVDDWSGHRRHRELSTDLRGGVIHP